MSRMAAAATADRRGQPRRISAAAPGGPGCLDQFELLPMRTAISHIKHSKAMPAGDSSWAWRLPASPSAAPPLTRLAFLLCPHAFSRESNLGRCAAPELTLEGQASPMHLNPPA